MMSFQIAAKSYLNELHDQIENGKHSGQHTPELSYRLTLDRFFRDVAGLIDPSISIVYEPRNQSRAGRPDWRFHNAKNLGVYGYAEAKPLEIEKNIKIGDFDEQVGRYFALGHRLIVTDGLEFNFYDPPNPKPTRIMLVDKPVVATDWSLLQPNALLGTRFCQFFETAASRKCSEEELVKETAKVAKELSDSIMELSGLPKGAGLSDVENKTIEALRELKTIVENHHDPRLRDRKAFSDFVAQVLIFGLLYSHRIVDAPDLSAVDRYVRIQSFWSDIIYSEFTEKLRPFRALTDLLKDELRSLGPLGTWYQDCCLLLAHIQLDQSQKATPDYHRLYERFLSIFDPKTRFDFGAFYTPRELAKFSVSFTQAIIDSELQGFSLYEKGNKLIDPCCGTGTFLEQLLSASNHSDLPRITGFEILPAPYALAHYRIAMLGQRQSYPPNLTILLTNTLSDELEREYGNQIASSLVEKEQAIARELSKPPLTLIIGNPPSSDSSIQSPKVNLSIIERLLEDFRPPLKARSTRQNIQKQLQNEFIRFLRWACNKLLVRPPGILTLVLPSSFAEHSSYYYARKWVASNFPKMWILDIDRDARTGAHATSLFNTLQGRLLLVGFTGMPGGKSKVRQIRYGSITDLGKEEKLSELSRERTPDEYLRMFEPLTLDTRTYNFRPSKRFDVEGYGRYWALYAEKDEKEKEARYVFRRHCSGIKLAPSSMFVHVSKALLQRKLRDVADTSLSLSEIKKRWFSTQDRPPADGKLSETIRKQIREVLDEGKDSIASYAYRPFVTVSAFISEPLFRKLARAGGGGTRYRPEVLSAFRSKETVGIAVAPAPKDIGEELHRFATFCWHLPDNDLCKRGNAHIFCNQFPEYKKDDSWNSEPTDNISPMLKEKLAASVDTPDEIIHYVYGILCSDSFMEKFEGALFTVADAARRPRIPFPASREVFKSIAAKGRKLAELEKEPSDSLLTPNFAVFGGLFTSSFSLSSYRLDENAERIELCENEKPMITIVPVPREILRFRISGYNVLQQWLKLYSYRYKRAQFVKEDYVQLLQLLCRIDEQIKLIGELDKDVDELLSGKTELL